MNPTQQEEDWEADFDRLHGKPLADYLAQQDYEDSFPKNGSIGLSRPNAAESKRFGNERMDKVKVFIRSLLATERRKTEDLADALIDMYGQYCSYGHDFMSAGENASRILEEQGYAVFDGAGRPTWLSLDTVQEGVQRRFFSDTGEVELLIEKYPQLKVQEGDAPRLKLHD